MHSIIKRANKNDGGCIATLIRGDNRTTEICFIANAPELPAWRGKIVNAAGATDSVVLEHEQMVGGRVMLRWRPNSAVATAVVGQTRVQLEGFADNPERLVWQSAVYILQIDEGMEAEPTEEEIVQFSEVRQLILYVSDQLPDVLAARDEARDAAQHPPVIGANGNWYLWDWQAGRYVDSGKPSQGGGSGSGGITQETDPTVPEWAKEPKKPKYTAEEVGAQPKGDYASKDDVDRLSKEVEELKESGGTGEPGEDGKDGGYYTPVVASDGTLTWTASKSDMPTVASASIKGPKGDAGEQGAAGEKGEKGADGVSPTVSVSKSGKVTTISITDKNGTKNTTVNDGADGQPGENGSNGKDGTSVTVKSVSESTVDGGSNVVTFSDGKTITIKNGSKGSTGETGAAGKTPAKGTDYWTAADIEEMVNDVIAALPVYNGEVV